jgi:hypothetical protein
MQKKKKTGLSEHKSVLGAGGMPRKLHFGTEHARSDQTGGASTLNAKLESPCGKDLALNVKLSPGKGDLPLAITPEIGTHPGRG